MLLFSLNFSNVTVSKVSFTTVALFGPAAARGKGEVRPCSHHCHLFHPTGENSDTMFQRQTADIRRATWFFSYRLLYFPFMFQCARFSLPGDYEHCSLLWKWLKRLNERFSLFQDAADTRTLSEISSVLLPALLYPFLSRSRMCKVNSVFLNALDDFTSPPLEVHCSFYRNCQIFGMQ